MEGQAAAAQSITKTEVEQMMAAHEQELEINVNKIIDDKLTLLQQGLVQAAST